MIFGKNVEQDETTCRVQEWQLAFLLLALSSIVIFDSDYSLISCPLCKSNTLKHIFMILGRNVEQDETTYRVQEWQLWLSFFGVISLYLVFDIDFVSAL